MNPIVRIVIFLTFIPLHTHAVDFARTNTLILQPHEVQREELWAAAYEVAIQGTVNEDFFIAGQSVDLSGQFKGDLWVASGTNFTMTGHGEDDLHAISIRTIHINGEIDRNLMGIAPTIHINTQAVVRKNAFLVGGDIICSGHIHSNLSIMASQVTLQGEINGTVDIIAEDIVVLPGTRIGGDLRYTTGNELILDDQVILNGTIIRESLGATQKRSLASHITSLLFHYTGALLVGALLLFLFPCFFDLTARYLRHNGLICAVLGLLTLLTLPFIILATLLSGVAIPVSILFAASSLLLFYFSKTVIALTLGALLLRKKDPISFRGHFSALVTGLLLLYILMLIPTLALFISMITVMWGTGAVLLAIVNRPRRIELKETESSI